MTSPSELLRSGILWVAQPNKTAPLAPWSAENVCDALGTELVRGDKRESIQHIPLGVPTIDSALPTQGLATKQIHEWLIPQARGMFTPPTTFLLHIAHSARKMLRRPLVVWVEREFWPSPHAISAILGADALNDCLFLAPPSENEKLWATTEALRSHAVALTIAPFRTLRLALTKKLALAAKDGGGLGCLLRPESARRTLTAAASRWSVSPQPTENDGQAWEVRLERWKGAQPPERRWVVCFSIETPTSCLHHINQTPDESATQRRRA